MSDLMENGLKKVAFEYSEQHVKEAARYYWKKERLKKIEVILSILLVIGCAYSTISGQEVNPQAAILVCVFVLSLFWGIKRYNYKKIVKKMQSQFGTVPGCRVDVAISDHFMIVSSPHGSAKVSWQEVAESWTSSHLLFLFLRNKQYIFFPVSEIGEEIRAYIVKRITAPPRQRQNDQSQ
jgi:YcxB-like protein